MDSRFMRILTASSPLSSIHLTTPSPAKLIPLPKTLCFGQPNCGEILSLCTEGLINSPQLICLRVMIYYVAWTWNVINSPVFNQQGIPRFITRPFLPDRLQFSSVPMLSFTLSFQYLSCQQRQLSLLSITLYIQHV